MVARHAGHSCGAERTRVLVSCVLFASVAVAFGRDVRPPAKADVVSSFRGTFSAAEPEGPSMPRSTSDRSLHLISPHGSQHPPSVSALASPHAHSLGQMSAEQLLQQAETLEAGMCSSGEGSSVEHETSLATQSRGTAFFFPKSDKADRDAWCEARVEARRIGRKVPRGRKHIMWWHLHNFAGTFMCHNAVIQGEHVPPLSSPRMANCNLPLDGCSSQKWNTNCKHRAHWALRPTFTSVERDAKPDDFCDQVITGVMFRDPLGAMRSTVVNNVYNKDRILGVLKGELASWTDVPHDGCTPEWDTYQHFDNFATRTLGGGYAAEPQKVTRAHLMLAKERLARMDVVLILEELGRHTVQLASSFGWDVSLIDTEHKKNQHSDVDSVFSASEVRFLKRINALDYELYDYAIGLAANRSASAINHFGLESVVDPPV